MLWLGCLLVSVLLSAYLRVPCNRSAFWHQNPGGSCTVASPQHLQKLELWLLRNQVVCMLGATGAMRQTLHCARSTCSVASRAVLAGSSRGGRQCPSEVLYNQLRLAGNHSHYKSLSRCLSHGWVADASILNRGKAVTHKSSTMSMKL